MSDILAETFLLEEVEDARTQAPEQKLRLGADLFDYACAITLGGIRHQSPGITEEQALELLRSRLRLGEKLEKMEACL